MLELGISQAQSQFTKLLSQMTVIIDKKSHLKKAVIMPYEEYKNLLAKASANDTLEEGSFSKFTGILDKDFKSDDMKYQDILK